MGPQRVVRRHARRFLTNGRRRGPRWSWAAVLLAFGCKAPAPEPVDPEPLPVPVETTDADVDYRSLEFSELLTKVSDPETCVSAMIEVAYRFGRVTADERSALVAESVPAMLQVWDLAPELRLPILRLYETVGDVGAAPIWNRALTVNELPSPVEEFESAARAVASTRAVTSLPTVHATMEWFLEHPNADRVQEAGAQRLLLVEAMIAIRDRSSVPVLLEVLKQPVDKQPVAVHRRTADALGILRDPAAVHGLILAPYDIPDAPSTKSVPERAKAALASIGEPAVEPLLVALRGEDAELNALLERNGLHQSPVGTMVAIMALGAIGSPKAVPALLEAMPDDDCGSRGNRSPTGDDDESWKPGTRAMYANTLGLIGDERAVAPLCRCAKGSRDPGELYPITEALGRIGGPAASACIAQVIRRGRYDADAVASPEFELEIRWEAVRHGLLAAGPGQLRQIESAIKAANRSPEVAKHTGQWKSGIEVLRRCKDGDLECFLAELAKPDQPWFAQEVAAINAARLAPGDARVAEAITVAYAALNPDLRATLAWLAGHMLEGKRCETCAQNLRLTLEGGDAPKRLTPDYQLSVLMGRTAIAKLRE